MDKTLSEQKRRAAGARLAALVNVPATLPAPLRELVRLLARHAAREDLRNQKENDHDRHDR